MVRGPNKAVHDVRLRSLLESFCEFNIAINPSNCVFSSETRKFPSYLIHKNDFRPYLDHVSPASCT